VITQSLCLPGVFLINKGKPEEKEQGMEILESI
jgi:hypothetical protein